MIGCPAPGRPEFPPVDAKSTLEALKFASQRELGEHLIEEYNVEVEQMTNCSICHR